MPADPLLTLLFTLLGFCYVLQKNMIGKSPTSLFLFFLNSKSVVKRRPQNKRQGINYFENVRKLLDPGVRT